MRHSQYWGENEMVYCENYTKACVYGADNIFYLDGVKFDVKKGEACVHSIPHNHAGLACFIGCAKCVDVLYLYMKEAIG